ncbi:NADH-quinone oxidoreductase subunit J [Rubrobacter radiotolerans]|uniref:NADH-quinone oxidoreductase subunit J n=1 Tax=Rubrobacter radiotolerans TaxID=42256 RepID=A0AB35T9R0_RUBRA|nr:NADH-quinone oxidoreductase subunit J [Rubrobacter radiotolerans]MDX5895158.1 NADH-quinone oxidoreductase subunit J [Rubrobacter radiotolerans]SMC07557.1 NADH dehydrogenase subunit J [Rubrobacter radiotolerans DSM 5868]
MTQGLLQTGFITLFGVAAVWFAVVVFRTSSMVRSAIALLFSQAAIGGMFLAMQAEFLGVLQIMMMATEMSIMAIFMVMFMMDPGGLGAMDMTHQKRLSQIAGVAGAFAALAVAFLSGWGPVAESAPGAYEQTRLLGLEIMERSMLIFETAGVTILTAMIAATATAIAARGVKRTVERGDE